MSLSSLFSVPSSPLPGEERSYKVTFSCKLLADCCLTSGKCGLLCSLKEDPTEIRTCWLANKARRIRLTGETFIISLVPKKHKLTDFRLCLERRHLTVHLFPTFAQVPAAARAGASAAGEILCQPRTLVWGPRRHPSFQALGITTR